jgi:16S rRNA (guanine527-N7)-methyltransferase
VSAAPLPPEGAERLFPARLDLAVRFAELLCTDGIAHGLIGPREAARIWPRHLLSSAAVAQLLPHGAAVVDLGSGAGLPGIPLAIARPDLQVTLAEPMARRVRFLEHAVAALGLAVPVVRARAQELAPAGWDAVVARAVAPLPALLEMALPLVRAGGEILAVKGDRAEDELAAAGPVLAQHPEARVHLDSVGEGEHTTRVVRVQLPPLAVQGAR